MNKHKNNNKFNKKKKHINSNFNINHKKRIHKNKRKHKKSFNKKSKNGSTNILLNSSKQSNPKKSNFICDNFIQTINNKSSIKYNDYKNKLINSFFQEFDYDEAIIYDKRSFLQIYFSILNDSQIILDIIFNNNNFDLFAIKLSLLVFNFQINFFLNSFFYTDEYISDAYHNNGVLDFIAGLPKSIYSFISAMIITNPIKMLSTSKNELIKIIRLNHKFNDYLNIIDIKLAKFRKKLIIYFILIFLFASFSLYYVTIFCAVYRYSQKYWIIGCIESFGMDFLSSLFICAFLSLFRYISIKKKIKYLYVFADIINKFL